MPSTPVPAPFVASIVALSAAAPEPAEVWLAWMVTPLFAWADRALPFPVLVAVTAGLVVELVKDAGPASAALARLRARSAWRPQFPPLPRRLS